MNNHSRSRLAIASIVLSLVPPRYKIHVSYLDALSRQGTGRYKHSTFLYTVRLYCTASFLEITQYICTVDVQLTYNTSTKEQTPLPMLHMNTRQDDPFQSIDTSRHRSIIIINYTKGARLSSVSLLRLHAHGDEQTRQQLDSASFMTELKNSMTAINRPHSFRSRFNPSHRFPKLLVQSIMDKKRHPL